MSKRSTRTPPISPAVVSPLSPEDLLVLNAYFSNGGNQTQAYKQVHPHCNYGTARTQAYRLMTKPHIQAEIARRTRYEVGITKEWGQTHLLDYEAMAKAKGDYVAGASICMDAMKLAGFLVEKRADVTAPPTLSESQLADELRKRGYVPVAAI